MKICDISSSTGRLLRQTTQLKELWAETKEHWNDSARNEFQEKHLEELAPMLTLTMAAITRFSESVAKVEKDLIDSDREEIF